MNKFNSYVVEALAGNRRRPLAYFIIAASLLVMAIILLNIGNGVLTDSSAQIPRGVLIVISTVLLSCAMFTYGLGFMSWGLRRDRIRSQQKASDEQA